MISISLSDSAELGVVYPCKSGFEWTTQAGGTYCSHPEAEGIFIPLWYDMDWDNITDPMQNYWKDGDAIALIQQFIDTYDLPFLAPSEEQIKDLDWGEAWVPVICNARKDCEVLGGLKGKLMFLTYPNSD